MSSERSDELSKGIKVVRIPDEPSNIREAIQKRLDSTAQSAGSTESPLTIDDGGFKVLEEISRGNIDFALYAFRKVIEAVMGNKELPCTITADDIRGLGLTYEQIDAIWDSPERDAIIINAKPWWEGD